MRRATRLEVHAHPRGPWLVRAGGRALAVPPMLGRALLPLHGARIGHGGQVAGPPGSPAAAFDADTEAAVAAVAAWIAACGEPRGPLRRRPAAFGPGPWRVPLLPAGLVRRVAAVLAPLASWPCLAYVAAMGLTTALALKPWAQPCSLTAPALLLFAGGALWHELGHAAALKREGYAPGSIGAGLLVCVPVLYADVSAVGLLPRGGRLRVDLAGLAFQAGAAGVFALAGAVPGPPAPVAAAARAAAVATLLALVWGLLPLPRSDGTWALRDALETRTGDEGAGDEGTGECSAGKAALRLRAGLTVVRFALGGAACWVLPPRLVGILAWACARFGCPLAPDAGATVAGILTALALAWWITRAACAIMRRGTPARKDVRVRDQDDQGEVNDSETDEGPRPLDLDGVLDLHMFAPAEARALVDDWLDASREAGLRDLRIIHGKGIGAMRTLVHAALEARDDVESYALATDASSWGATLIRMKP